MECCVEVSVEWKRAPPAVAHPLYILGLVREDDPGGERGGFQNAFSLDKGRRGVSFRSVRHRLLLFQPPGGALTFRGHFEAGPVGVEPSEGPSTLSAASGWWKGEHGQRMERSAPFTIQWKHLLIDF